MLQRLLLAPILLVAAATYMYPVQATFSTAVYPSVTPKPKSITRHFKTVSIVNPKNVNIDIRCMQANKFASAHCHTSILETVQSGAKRVFDSMTNNVKVGVTLPYLKVKLPPL
eukprot:g1873.t1